MESNKDEALRALNIAQRRRDAGDVSGARKFARKSLALFSTPAAQKLLDSLDSMSDSSSTNGSASGSASTSSTAFTSATETHPSAGGSSHRKAPEKADEKKRDYTPENLAVVKRVLTCKVTEYYEILELKRDCEDNEVKRAYRKLALALHPDKNGAPGADEAFKLVSKAFQVLSDSEKRALYDRHGSDPESRFSGMSARSHSTAFANGSPFGGASFDGEISPEDLFNMFFGGGGVNGMSGFGGGPGVFTASFGPGGFRTTRVFNNARQQEGTQRDEPLTTRQLLTNLLPIILLFAFSILSALPSLFSTPPPADPRFAFAPSTRFNVERQTHGLGVPYHVNAAEFTAHPIAAELARGGDSTPNLARFEDSVDRAWTNDKYAQCQRGVESKRRRREAASGFFGIGADWEALKRIDEEKVDACEVLRSKGLLRG